MNTLTRLLTCAAVAAVSAAQVASGGVLITNHVRNARGMGLKVVYGPPPTYSKSYHKPNIRCGDRSSELNKVWIGWDLQEVWDTYGQTNLVDAIFTYWGENGTTRSFWVAALADSVGLDGWDNDSIHWTNAPANILYTSDPGTPQARCAFDYSKCFLGTNIWEGWPGSIAVNLANPGLGTDFDQAARYTVTNEIIRSNFVAWLKTDTDGKVTLMASGMNNQNWWVGTNGTYAGDLASNLTSIQPESFGQVCRDSPTLTLVFDVRVALTGGGMACPGGSGPEVYLAGTDVGFDYLLYTNGVYTGQKVSGTGSAVSFGQQNVAATYTCVESNITTTATRVVPGTVVVGYYSPPVITAQPTSFVAATNSVAFFRITVTNVGGGLTYQWYRNGVALSDDGRITGTTGAQLLINPVLASDAATTANGYYCVVTDPCGNTVTSVTNALTIQPARTIVWIGAPTNLWDIASTVNWSNPASSTMTAFNQGDNVLLDDNAVSTGLLLASPYLSPGTITFNASGQMGIGALPVCEIYGPNSSLVVNGPTINSRLIITNANSFAGGTTINDGWLTLLNNSAVGPGTITLAGTGNSLLEVNPTGGANAGFPGVHVTADSTLQFNGSGAYASVIVGPITGVPGKKLTISKLTGTSSDNFRVYHTNFTCDADIELNIGSANFAPYNEGGTQIYNGVISGSGVLFTRMGGGTIILNGANTYNGGTRLSMGITGVGIDSVGVDYGVTSGPFGTGPITIEGNVALFASGGPRTVGNSVGYTASGGTLTFTGTNVLTMAGTFDLGSGGITTATNRTISVAPGAEAIISGVIADSSGLGCGLTKSGAGTLYLNGANTYTGNTIINAGVLAGTGSIAGSVVVTGGGLGGGSPSAIGTLSVGGNVTFNGGGAFIRVNRSGLQCDKVSVGGTLTATAPGTITVTNLGPDLQPGDKFVLFPGKTVTGGSTLTVTGAGKLWTNKLELDGSIEVLGVAPPPVNPNPTNISFSVSAGTLNLSWPASHTGWRLQVQTNALNVGISTNWVDVPGSESTNQVAFPINPTNGTVFFRLIYQLP